ncbi:hypothetical protein ACF2JD_12275 [Aeromonas sp. A-5]|uniref:hypothetical protein n=1 Tax=Aeromonas ichthyocola TaxID=3367746 RepID=UPI0038EBEF10
MRSVTRVNGDLLATSPRLGFVGTATIGTDHVDKALLASRNIPFFSAPGATSIRSAIMCSPPCWCWRSAMNSASRDEPRGDWGGQYR